ncbi:MAG: hypothetical protein C0467_30690 [Planctomycetaceae bacterium]|nr:hypothetical protein [Planctomycetaceae bacterium]
MTYRKEIPSGDAIQITQAIASPYRLMPQRNDWAAMGLVQIRIWGLAVYIRHFSGSEVGIVCFTKTATSITLPMSKYCSGYSPQRIAK